MNAVLSGTSNFNAGKQMASISISPNVPAIKVKSVYCNLSEHAMTSNSPLDDKTKWFGVLLCAARRTSVHVFVWEDEERRSTKPASAPVPRVIQNRLEFWINLFRQSRSLHAHWSPHHKWFPSCVCLFIKKHWFYQDPTPKTNRVRAEKNKQTCRQLHIIK